LQFKGPIVDRVDYYVGMGYERGPHIKYTKRKVDFSPEILKIIKENLNKEQELLMGYDITEQTQSS